MHVLLAWWQQLPQNLDKIAFSVASIPVYWYALFFLAGAFAVYLFAKAQYLKQGIFSLSQYKDFAFGVFLSALGGGKLGFLIFYWYPFVSRDNISGFLLPKAEGLALPGMSFAGGLIAVAAYVYWFAGKQNKKIFQLTDILALFLPIAVFFGRLGSFIHGELKGRVTEMPWGMYFPGETALRHPSTLYEAFFEGIILFSILLVFNFFFFKKKKLVPGMMTAFFCIFYGLLRFAAEFFREPDVQIGYFGVLTLNQIFALGICIGGIVIFSIQNAKK